MASRKLVTTYWLMLFNGIHDFFPKLPPKQTSRKVVRPTYLAMPKFLFANKAKATLKMVIFKYSIMNQNIYKISQSIHDRLR